KDGKGGSLKDDIKTLPLVNEEYSTHGYSDYEEKKIRVALFGNIEVAALRLKVEVENDKFNFLSISFNNEGGIWRAERSGVSTLDTNAREGFFVKATSPEE